MEGDSITLIRKQEITLTDDQKRCFELVKEFLKEENKESCFVISGSAGTGKTTLLKYIADYILSSLYVSLVAVAPTHKAKRVLSKFLNNSRFIEVPCFTIASVLGKMPEHSYIGTRLYSKGKTEKMDKYNYFILDEVSMVADTDLQTIINYICNTGKKLILIGDYCQIPSPSQKYIKKGDMCYKPNSFAFDLENFMHLTQIVRQAQGSNIVKIATYIRDHIKEDIGLEDIITFTGISSSELCIERDDLYSMFIEDYSNKKDSRIIAYTNNCVRTHNIEVRRALKYKEPIVKGELLTGYNNMGYPEIIIGNGIDYKVKNVASTNNYKVLDFVLHGYTAELKEVDDVKKTVVFIIEVNNNANYEFIQELVRRAEQVNKLRSTKEDFKRYRDIKDRVVFMENVYKFNGKIYTETTFKQTHPLLYTKIGEVVDFTSMEKISSVVLDNIEDTYGYIIEERISDNKKLSDGETLADRFMIVEKDVYYGYSITAHKSQGSTYDCVYVDEVDFRKLSNRWNTYLKAYEQRHIERNQIKYVAYTRPKDKLKIVV